MSVAILVWVHQFSFDSQDGICMGGRLGAAGMGLDPVAIKIREQYVIMPPNWWLYHIMLE